MRWANSYFAMLHLIVLTSPSFTAQTSTRAEQSFQRDPQALTILSKAVNAAGGLRALSAIQDFTASGTVTYNWGGDPAEGTVEVKGRGLSQFRIDAALSDGAHSWIVTSSSALEKHPDGSTSSMTSPLKMKPASITFPFAELAVALQDTSWSISYVGLVTHGGQQAYDISLQKTFSQSSDPSDSQSRVTKADFFIDPITFSVLSMQDKAYRKDHLPGELLHEIQFSKYQIFNGILVPLSIKELIGGQQTFELQLTQITFNTGLTDSDFAL